MNLWFYDIDIILSNVSFKPIESVYKFKEHADNVGKWLS